MWTPLQKEHAARIYLQRELAAEEALANSGSSTEFDSTPCPLAPAGPDLLSEFDISPASLAPANAAVPSGFDRGRSSYAPGNLEFPSEFDESPSPHAPAKPELPSEFDLSPPLHAQPPPPVVLKAHQRAKLDERFHARVDSPTPSEDTYQRLLQGCSFSTATPKTPLESYTVDPASLVRPSAPEPRSFTQYDDQQAEIDQLRQKNAGLERQLQAYKDMADSLIEQSVERAFDNRDERRLTRRVERLQRRLDEDDGVITQQKIQLSCVTDERDGLKSSLQRAYDIIKTMHEDMNQQADRIEDLEGDLHDAHRELYSRITTH